MDIERIPADILQIFTSAQAREYLLVPLGRQDNKLMCYGHSQRDYSQAMAEIEVLMGYDVEIECVDADRLQRLLNHYYRDNTNHKRQGASFSIGDNNFLHSLIDEAFSTYSSDIHIEPYEDSARVRMRIDGKLIERYSVEKANYGALINQIKIISNLDISEKRLPQDGRILFESSGKKFDVRVSCLPTIYGEKVVMRLLTRHIELLELSNLGFTEKQLEDYCHAIEKPHGLVLICGPTGSGKSTTLYATLRRLNSEKDNILTIEDPVEYTLDGINQVQLKEEIGLTFPVALRTFLRQDPDIIMLGEIRDTDTAQMAIRSSLTGHLIFSTIHTNSAWGSVARLADMGVHPYLVSNTLIMCVAQRLVRLLCPKCKRAVDARTETNGMLSNEIAEVYIPTGCDECFHTGYRGRKAIYEVITIDNELSELIRSNEQNIDKELASRGIVTMKQAALEMVCRGETSPEEIIPILNS